MSYLIDTDYVIDYLTGQTAAVAQLRTLRTDGVAISVVTFTEIYEGIYGGRDPGTAEQGFRAFLAGTRVLGYTRTIAKQTARIRNDLRSRRRPIDHRALDLVIAATALTYGLTLITRNTRDYSDISGLQVYQGR
ncbi:MAG: type II toxin-antitoxin system VapC family toxin [Chloroflexota bacterium]|nr:type II toxin-antitoxin system VapC family toxin [Chloroflexota bacterium]